MILLLRDAMVTVVGGRRVMADDDDVMLRQVTVFYIHAIRCAIIFIVFGACTPVMSLRTSNEAYM